MTFRATNALPALGYEQAKADAVKLRRYCVMISLQLAANFNAKGVNGIKNTLNIHKTRLLQYRNISGIADYAKGQEVDPTYDVVAEFLNVLALIDAAIATIQLTPVTAYFNTAVNNGHTDDDFVWVNFTPAQTAGLRADLDAIVASVS